MKILEPGHFYQLSNGDELEFIKVIDGRRIPGTTTEEVLEVLINRTVFLNAVLPCGENEAAISLLREALRVLNLRTQRRQSQGVESTDKPHV